MSSRFYPLYQRGNPQLRIFLPNFWMKLVKLENITLSKNVVAFSVSPEMTKLDVKNYMEKIYNIPVMNVKTYNHATKVEHSKYPRETNFAGVRGNEKLLTKEPDIKYAFVTLPKDYEFKFPNVTTPLNEIEKKQKFESMADEMKKHFVENNPSFKKRQKNVSPWFNA